MKMKAEEIAQLKEQDGANFNLIVEEINDYCASVGKRYKNYAATYRNWKRRKFKNSDVTIPAVTKDEMKVRGLVETYKRIVADEEIQ